MLRQLRSFSLPLLFVIFVTFTVPALAQYGASLQGTITDQSGAVVAGATITATNQSTSVVSSATSTNTGFYRVSGLAPGKYTVKVDAPTFKSSVSKDVGVNAESLRGFDIKLQAGAASDTVTVTSGAETVQTQDADLSRTMTTLELTNLPQIGRDPYELVRLTPGVLGDGARNGSGNAIQLPQQVGTGGSNSYIFQIENQLQVVSKGQRISANNIMLDGVSANSLDWGGAAVLTPNQDSVNELTVVSNDFSAADGRNSGITVKVISKNGTNNFHGGGFIKFDDPGLNAFNRFNGPGDVPERVNNKYRQFGGNLGGPLLKDKLFFFFSYEGVRQSTSNLARNVKLETPAFDQYVIANNPGSIAAQIFQTPGYAARIVNTHSETDFGSLDGRPLGSWYQAGPDAAGAGPDGIPDWGVYDLLIPSSLTGNQFNGRMDYNVGKNQFFFSTYVALLDSVGGGNRPLEDQTLSPINWIGTVGWTRTISGTLLNELRGNITRYHYDQTVPSGLTNYGIPQIRLFDFDAGGLGDMNRIGIAQSGTSPGKQAQNTIAFRDTVSWIRGRHAFKFGAEHIKEQNNNDQRGQYRPDYQFRGLLNLANDACCFFEGVAISPLTGGVPNGLRHYRSGDSSLFVMDTWSLKPNLSFTLGLRYEYFSPYKEADDFLTNYFFGSQGEINGSVRPVNQLYKPDRNNWSPHVAVAWSPEALHNRVVLRSGFAVLYNRDNGTVWDNVRQNTPFFAFAASCCFFDPGPINGPPPGSNILYGIGSSASAFSYAPNPAFANGVAPDGALCSSPGCATIQRVDLFGALPNEPNPYVYSFSTEVQYEFIKNYVLTVGYYGSRSRKLLRTIDLNRLVPGDTFDNNHDFVQNDSADGNPCGPANPTCPAVRATGNNRFNRIFFPLPDVNASYDSLVTTVRHNFSHGLSFQGSWTWSHSIDTASYELGYQQTDPSNPIIDKGNSDYDVRHNFVANVVWELPWYRNRRDFMGEAFGGWSISSIYQHHTGFPFSALIGSCDTNRDRNGDSYCPDLPFTYAGGILSDPSKLDWMTGVFPDPAASFPGATVFPPPTATRGPGCRCRNIFTGPGYTSVDMSLAKQFLLPTNMGLGEGARFDFRANFFNMFNILNLAPLVPATAQTDILNGGQFGRTPTGLAGRVVEFQARFSF